LAEFLILLAKIVLAVVWLLSLTFLLTWAERKESAVIQDRIGANRAAIFGVRAFGLFQPFADAIKMIRTDTGLADLSESRRDELLYEIEDLLE
jgi:NADH-quinone oxidoreductase subunit H